MIQQNIITSAARSSAAILKCCVPVTAAVITISIKETFHLQQSVLTSFSLLFQTSGPKLYCLDLNVTAPIASFSTKADSTSLWQTKINEPDSFFRSWWRPKQRIQEWFKEHNKEPDPIKDLWDVTELGRLEVRQSSWGCMRETYTI